MSSKITQETVENVARLASLKISKEELPKYVQKFSRVLEYVGELDKLKLKGVEPTYHAGVVAELALPNLAKQALRLQAREDVAEKFSAADSILENAPEKDGRLVRVPRVIQ